MNQIAINIPGARITYNYLYEAMPLDWREEDLLFVRLANGYAIDVGWYPACDPNGRFKITLSDSAQNTIDVRRVFALDEVVRAVENFAQRDTRTTSRVFTLPYPSAYRMCSFSQYSTNSSSGEPMVIPELDLSHFVQRPSVR